MSMLSKMIASKNSRARSRRNAGLQNARAVIVQRHGQPAQASGDCINWGTGGPNNHMCRICPGDKLPSCTPILVSVLPQQVRAQWISNPGGDIKDPFAKKLSGKQPTDLKDPFPNPGIQLPAYAQARQRSRNGLNIAARPTLKRGHCISLTAGGTTHQCCTSMAGVTTCNVIAIDPFSAPRQPLGLRAANPGIQLPAYAQARGWSRNGPNIAARPTLKRAPGGDCITLTSGGRTHRCCASFAGEPTCTLIAIDPFSAPRRPFGLRAANPTHGWKGWP